MLTYWHLARHKVEINRHLIPWTASARFELEANEVLCLTPNLVWAQVNLPNILDNIRSRTSKKYRYIVFNNKFSGYANDALHNAREIMKQARSDQQVRDANGISILFLTRDDAPSGSYCWTAKGSSTECPPVDDWAYLPIPTDLVVYIDTVTNLEARSSSTRKTFAVMSISPVESKIVTAAVAPIAKHIQQHRKRLRGLLRKKSFGFDIQLVKEEHYDPIKVWFNWEWERRTDGAG
jgi:hypothetical protein